MSTKDLVPVRELIEALAEAQVFVNKEQVNKWTLGQRISAEVYVTRYNTWKAGRGRWTAKKPRFMADAEKAALA